MSVIAVAAGACWLLALHPFTTYPLSLALARALRPSGQGDPNTSAGTVNSVAICFCVRNEEAILSQKLANLKAVRDKSPTPIPAYVYFDGSTDAGESLARNWDNPVTIVADSVNRGKGHGLNTLIGLAKEDIIVFTDANVLFHPEAVPRLLTRFADPAVGCVCGRLEYVNADESDTARIGGLYWRLEEIIKTLESATGSVMGADGSIFAIRRELFVPIPPTFNDDLFISLGVLYQGRRIVSAQDALAFERNAADKGQEYRRKRRIACRAFTYFLHHVPSILGLGPWNVYKFVSHKLLRWLTIFFLAWAVMLSLLAAFGWAWALGILLVGSGLLVLGLRTDLPIVSPVAGILAAFTATGLGVLEAVVGRTYVSWQPADSSRK